MLDQALLQSLLPHMPVRVYDETASTNTDARNWLLTGAEHGSLVAAARQSSGRGRMGRAFLSQEGGLYMSLVLKSDLPAGVLTTLCAVAVRRAVAELGGPALDIKWVNDLQHRGKKVCGILCEGVWAGNAPLGVIAGIGLNVCQTSFDPALADIAASLYPEGQPPFSLEYYAAAITRQVLDLLPQAPAHMAEYRSACLTLGCQVQWQQGARQYSGLARAIDDTGALLIDTESGPVVLSAGEVSIRPCSTRT